MLTKKESAELKRLNRKILVARKGTRKDVMRAFELQQKKQAKAADAPPA